MHGQLSSKVFIIVITFICRRFNLDKVLSMEDSEQALERADIHIESPPLDDVTDEDSGFEDGNVSMNNLPGRQLY